jgi:hypothetical protein
MAGEANAVTARKKAQEMPSFDRASIEVSGQQATRLLWIQRQSVMSLHD